MADAIPAPGYRKFTGDKRPHLTTEALRAVRMLAADGKVVPPPAVTLLVVLCDAVESSHGQWYGSIETLAKRNPWSYRWFTKWLPKLVEYKLVERIEGLPGRKLATYQVLPKVYRDEVALVGTDVPTRKEDAEVPRSSTQNTGEPAHPSDPLVGTDVPSLVGTIASRLVGTGVPTNTRTPDQHQEEHPLTVAPPSSSPRAIPCGLCESTSCTEREAHSRERARQALLEDRAS